MMKKDRSGPTAIKTSRLNTYYGNARTTTSREVGATYPEKHQKKTKKRVIKYLKEIGFYTIFRLDVQTIKSDSPRRTKKN
jgi:hypothetical protein